MGAFDFHRLIFILSLIIGTWLSAWVYFAGKKEAINKLFSVMVLLWIMGEIIPYFIFRNFYLPKNIIVFLPKLEVFFVFIFFIFFYFFSIKFSEEGKKYPFLTPISFFWTNWFRVFWKLFFLIQKIKILMYCLIMKYTAWNKSQN